MSDPHFTNTLIGLMGLLIGVVGTVICMSITDHYDKKKEKKKAAIPDQKEMETDVNSAMENSPTNLTAEIEAISRYIRSEAENIFSRAGGPFGKLYGDKCLATVSNEEANTFSG